MAHAYPRDLAQFVHDELAATGQASDVPTLVHVLSAAYQASLLRDEERPLTFRLLLGDASVLPIEGGPPTGHHRLRFDQPRRFDEEELRRLAPAAKMQRAMIGVAGERAAGLHIWGLVHTGPGWLRAIQGGRGRFASLPPVLSVAATGPGRVVVSLGDVTIAKLAAGMLTGRAPDVFESRWLPASFADMRSELVAEHRATHGGSVVHADMIRMVGQHVTRRLIASIRLARHGGSVVFLSLADAQRVVATGRPIHMKYRFADEEPRRRYATLVLRLLDVLARQPGEKNAWHDYLASEAQELGAIDEAFMEFAHTAAELSEIDGVVVMSKRFELLGFGGEIVGDLPEVTSVRHALDLEGETFEEVSTDGVGTRHRSVYRLCAALRDTLGIVVSQDGGVRLVGHKDGAVTFWDQFGTGPMEV